MTGGPGWDEQKLKGGREGVRLYAITAPRNLFRYAMALEKASRILCGGCSCQLLVHLAIIQGGSYPEVSVKLCYSCLLFFYRMLKRIVWYMLDISITQDCCFMAYSHVEIYQQFLMF